MFDAIYVEGNSSPQRREDGLDRAISALADRQHGEISRAQLIELGLTADNIGYRLRVGRLYLRHRSVYGLALRPATKEARWMGAVLAAGSGAVLSHHSAAELWGLLPGLLAPIEVSAPRARRPRSGLAFHRVLLPPDEVTSQDGIPLTTVPRTIFDLAPSLRPRRLERLLNEAEIRRLWGTLSLEKLLHRYPRRQGSRAVRALLETRKAGATITRSELELLFLEFADGAGLPRPRTNQLIEGLEVDVVWREQRLIVELDGYETHRTRTAFERDRERSRILQAAHWRVVPVTYRQLCHAPGAVERDLRRLLGLSAFTLAA